MGDGKTTEEGQGRVAQAAAALNGQSKAKVSLGFSKRGPIPICAKLALTGSVPGVVAAPQQLRFKVAEQVMTSVRIRLQPGCVTMTSGRLLDVE